MKINPWDGPICDFCCAERPAWTFDGANPEAGLRSIPGVGLVMISDNGVWAACEKCAALVEAGDPERLAEVAVAGNETGRTKGDLQGFFAKVLPGLSPKRPPSPDELSSGGGMDVLTQRPEEN